MGLDRFTRAPANHLWNCFWNFQWHQKGHSADESFPASTEKPTGLSSRTIVKPSGSRNAQDGRSPGHSTQSRYFLRSSQSAQLEIPVLAAIGDAVEMPATEIAHAGKETVLIAKCILAFDELPEWMQEDPHIRHGYRTPSNSFNACVSSLFYPHNELVNTWSHLLPAIFFLFLLLAADCTVLCSGVEISFQDNLIMQTYIGGTACCLFFSVSEISVQICAFFSLLIDRKRFLKDWFPRSATRRTCAST